MTRNFNQPFLGLDGAPAFVADVQGKAVALTLKSETVGLLLSGRQMDTPDEKLNAYDLAMRIRDAGDGDTELTIEDAAFIKQKIGVSGTPLALGQVAALLEGE